MRPFVRSPPPVAHLETTFQKAGAMNAQTGAERNFVAYEDEDD